MPLRLFLIRHGESVDNVAGLLAGIRDSPLTSHGVLQARRLGAHLAARDIGRISNIFASNLQRAAKTAEAVAEAQPSSSELDAKMTVTQLAELREKNFGSDEGVRFSKRASSATAQPSSSSAGQFVPHESHDAMQARCQRFVAEHLRPAVSRAGADPDANLSIVVVAHGIILNHLLRCLLASWGPDEFAKLPGASDEHRKREWLAAWSNTGYLEAQVRIKPVSVATASSSVVDTGKAATGNASDVSSALPARSLSSTHPRDIDIQLSVKRVNCVEHLQGLKKTRGGIGSAGFDEKQKTMDSYFSRPAKKAKRDDVDH